MQVCFTDCSLNHYIIGAGVKFVIKCVVVVICTLVVAACDKAVKSSSNSVLTTSVKLAVVPDNVEASEIVFSHDGRRVAIAAVKDGASVVLLDGNYSAPYQGVRDLLFGKKNATFIFIANSNGKESLVINGVAGKLYDSIGKCLIMPNGRVLYAARSNDKWVIISGADESEPLVSNNMNLELSDSTGRFVYTELNPTTNKSHLRICSNDLKGCSNSADYDAISGMMLDSAGTRLAYLVSNSKKTAFVSVDMTKPGVYEAIGDWHDEVSIIALSEDATHYAYLAKNGSQNFLVIDGKRSAVSTVGIPLQMVVSNAGHAIYLAVHGSNVVAYLDGKRIGREYNSIDSPSFSPDGAHYALIVEQDEQDRIIVDGVEKALFEKIVDARFSRDSSTLAYRARQNGSRFVVAADALGRKLKKFPNYEAVWGYEYLPDGKSVGYGVKVGKELWWMVEKL